MNEQWKFQWGIMGSLTAQMVRRVLEDVDIHTPDNPVRTPTCVEIRHAVQREFETCHKIEILSTAQHNLSQGEKKEFPNETVTPSRWITLRLRGRNDVQLFCLNEQVRDPMTVSMVRRVL